MSDPAKNAARYEYVRRLNPQQFQALWQENLKTGRHFDDLVDDAIARTNSAGNHHAQEHRDN